MIVSLLAPSRPTSINQLKPQPKQTYSTMPTTTTTRRRQSRLLAALLVSAASSTAQVSIPLTYKARPTAAAATAAAAAAVASPGRSFLNFMTIGAEGGMAETEGLRMIVEKEVCS